MGHLYLLSVYSSFERPYITRRNFTRTLANAVMARVLACQFLGVVSVKLFNVPFNPLGVRHVKFFMHPGNLNFPKIITHDNRRGRGRRVKRVGHYYPSERNTKFFKSLVYRSWCADPRVYGVCLSQRKFDDRYLNRFVSDCSER